MSSRGCLATIHPQQCELTTLRMPKNKKATMYSMLCCSRPVNQIQDQAKRNVQKHHPKHGRASQERNHLSILQDLLNLDKQPPITGPARDRMQEINASIPKLQAIQAYTSPRNELAAEIARAIFHFESVRMSAGCECNAGQRQVKNSNAALTSQNSVPPPHSAHPKSPNSSDTAPSPDSRSSRAPSPSHTPETAAASQHAVPP